jgi:hypothetical protein
MSQHKLESLRVDLSFQNLTNFQDHELDHVSN